MYIIKLWSKACLKKRRKKESNQCKNTDLNKEIYATTFYCLGRTLTCPCYKLNQYFSDCKRLLLKTRTNTKITL